MCCCGVRLCRSQDTTQDMRRKAVVSTGLLDGAHKDHNNFGWQGLASSLCPPPPTHTHTTTTTTTTTHTPGGGGGAAACALASQVGSVLQAYYAAVCETLRSTHQGLDVWFGIGRASESHRAIYRHI
jgi:hypothetical protein